MLPSWTFVKKKRKQFSLSKEKKTSPFFWKICVKYFLQKTKRTLLKTSCSKKKCCFFWFTKKKRKTRLWCRTFWLNCKTLLILFEAKFAYCQKQNREHLPLEENKRVFFCLFQSCFLFQVTKMKEAKNKQTKSKVFFSFCQDNNLVVQDNKTFFCFTIVQKKQAFVLKKKQIFFLVWEVEKLPFCKKKCEHQRFVTKSNGQFHFFVTPTHQVMIVITNFNVLRHLPTQVSLRN